MRTSKLMLLLISILAAVGARDVTAEEQATVTTQAGDVYFGRVERSGESVRLERTDGSVLTFPTDVVASVVPVESPAAARPELPYVSPAVAAPVAPTPIAYRTAVVHAREPSPPPPPLPSNFMRTAAPRVIDVDRTVQASAAASSCATNDCYESPWGFRGAIAMGLGKGNSDFFDLRLDGEVEREPTPWGFSFGFTYVYGSRDGEASANNWKALARGERKLGARNYAFGQVLYERDPLADLVYRWTVTVGVGRTFVDTKADTFKGEVGLGLTMEKRDLRDQTTDPSGWVGLDYEHRWSGNCRFTAVYAFRPNFGDFDLSASTLELKYLAPCFSCADFIIGLRLDHVIDPPGEGVKSLDLLFTVGLTFAR